MEIQRKTAVQGRGLTIHREGELVWLTFPSLEETGIVRHLFSTRLGGVSEGFLSSMNLSYTRGDRKENVDENFRRIGTVLGRDMSDFVCTDQTHTANVRRVGYADKGKGIVLDKDYRDVDGIVTNEPGIVLSAFFADCVPLFFVDPVKRAVGLAHSGWKGTVRKIGKVTVQTMTEQFGSRPADIVAAIGPSICGDCYEVGEDVAGQFRQIFSDREEAKEERERIHGRFGQRPLLTDRGNGKYLLDLWEANYRVMLEAGVPADQISVTDLCTCCNPELLFSHRASLGKRGNLGAFLMLQEG